MSVILELSAETESKLHEEARKRGLDAAGYARLLIERLLMPSEAEAEEVARLAAIDAALGAFATVPYSSDDLAREKQLERDREEAEYEKQFA